MWFYLLFIEITFRYRISNWWLSAPQSYLSIAMPQPCSKPLCIVVWSGCAIDCVVDYQWLYGKLCVCNIMNWRQLISPNCLRNCIWTWVARSHIVPSFKKKKGNFIYCCWSLSVYHIGIDKSLMMSLWNVTSSSMWMWSNCPSAPPTGSVRVYDYMLKQLLCETRYNRPGTTLTWLPKEVCMNTLRARQNGCHFVDIIF